MAFNDHLYCSNIVAEFQQTPLKYAMENIAGDVSISMSVQSQSTAMQIADVSIQPQLHKTLGAVLFLTRNINFNTPIVTTMF